MLDERTCSERQRHRDDRGGNHREDERRPDRGGFAFIVATGVREGAEARRRRPHPHVGDREVADQDVDESEHAVAGRAEEADDERRSDERGQHRHALSAEVQEAALDDARGQAVWRK